MWNQKIQQLAKQESDGLLPSILFPSAVAYFDNHHSLVCADCANRDKEESVFTIVDYCLVDDTQVELCESCSQSLDPALR